LHVRDDRQRLQGVIEHGVELSFVEGIAFGGALNLDEVARSGHDHVHIDIRASVHCVVEIELWRAVDDTDGDGADRVAQGVVLELAFFLEPLGGERQSDVAASEGGGARAAVGLNDVAVDRDGAFTEL